MNSIKEQIAQQLKELGATDKTINTVLHGETRDEILQSVNVFLAATMPHQKNIEILRSYLAKGNDKEIIAHIKKAKQDISNVLTQV